MAKTELTKEIERALFYHTKAHLLGIYAAFEVCLGKGYGNEYVDYMTMTSTNRFTCYEIKSSLNDFNSNAKVSFVGDNNYYVMPLELWEKVKEDSGGKLLHCGVLVYMGDGRFAKGKASPCETLRISDRVNLMHCMVRSLSRLTTKHIQSHDK